MKIRLGEALRLKNEVKAAVGRLQRKFGGFEDLCFGITHKEDAENEEDEGQENFDVVYEKLEKLLSISHSLNDAIDFANKTAGIPSLARRKGNIEALMQALEAAIPKSSARTYIDKQNVVEGGQLVTQEKKITFIPFMNKRAIRSLLVELRTEKRAIIQTITTLDADTIIELPFSYEEVDDFIV